MKKVEQQQIYSIRKNKAYGASSVLIGLMGTTLLLGGLTPAVQAEENDVKPEPKPVDASDSDVTNASTVETAHLIVTSSQPTEGAIKPETKLIDAPKVNEENPSSNAVNPTNSTSSQPKEETTTPTTTKNEAKLEDAATSPKRAVSIVYKVRYVDRKSHKIVHEVTKTKTVETTEAKAKSSVTENGAELANNSQLENYNVPEGNPTTMTKEIVEGADNVFVYEVEGFGEAETPKERTVALKDTVEYVDKKSGLVLASEEKEETVSTTETVAKKELKVRYENTMIEIKALNAEAEQLLKKVSPSESSKAGLQATYQLAKQEEAAAQALLSKENVTKAELQSNLERLTAVVERLYSELKANGHSGDVRFMLETETAANEAPYMTMERYFGTEVDRIDPNYKIVKDGSTIEVKYKMGLTNITSDEVELTPDAKHLGFTFNDGDRDNRYLTKTLTLDNTIEAKTYIIGLQSKKNPNIKITARLSIEEAPLYEIVDNYAESTRDYILNNMNNQMGDSVTYDKKTSTAYMTSTPFGYYLYDRKPKTIEDVTTDTPQYTSNLWLALNPTGNYRIVGDKPPVTITKFEQTGGSPGVKVEFIVDKTPKASNVFAYDSAYVTDILTGPKGAYSLTSIRNDELHLSPYRINFKSLPAKAGTYHVDFNITDNLGRVTKYHLNLVTREISQTTPTDNVEDTSGNYTLTNADVMLDADKLYRVTNPIPVAVPISDKEQNLGNLVLNKANATLKIDSKPDGVEITQDPEDSTKYKIVKQNGKTLTTGVYTITATAKDGHFGGNVPARTYKFEVMDGLNAIGDQTWTEGQTIPNIPVSMTNGSKITSLSVESDGEHLYLSPNADNTGLTGYALKHTDAPQRAIVTATYINNEGQSRQIKTSFTYTVTPPPVSDLTLSVTDDKQTVSEGTKFADMHVTATEGATVTVGTLPAGVSYDAEHKVLSGTGQYEGHYVIPVTATKDNKSITKLVDLIVTPGNFNVPTANYTFTAGNEITPITLNIPSNATVSSVGGTLPRGLSWSADRKTITGTPTQVGTFQVYGYVKRTTAGGTNQSTYGYVNITVKSVPLNFSIPDNTKTVKALDELPPIKLQADGAVLSITSGSLPPGVNYDAATKTVSGTPTKVGTYTATFTATSPTISGNSTASATLTINVTSRDLSVDVKNKEQEKTVLTAIDNVVLTPSDAKARLEVDTSQLPPGVTYDAARRTISGTPSKIGEYLIPYKATFPEMAESPVDGGHIKINVRPLPVNINVTDKEQTIRLGETIKNMVVSHSEHSDLGARYLSVDLPERDIDSYLESTAGLNYNAATHTITGTPTKPGVYKIRLKATINSETLGKGSAEEIITVTVVDDPVSLDIKNDRQMIALGKTSLRPITFKVPDGVTLAVDTTKLPAGVTYDEFSKTISGTPTIAGAFDIPVTVTNAGKTKSITKDITIDVVDLTPPMPTVTVKDNNDGTHTVTISQPNGQPVETIIKNGKDGETPKVKVDRDETKKETTLTFYSDKNANNQFDEGTDTVLGTSVIKDGQDGAVGAKGDKGDAGAAGRDGKDVLNGKVNPEASQGKEGDKYVNTETGDVFVKNNGNWDKEGNIRGAKGETGAAGPKGDKGDKGDVGSAGKDGFTPTVSIVTNSDGSHTISITQPDGKEPITTTVKNGENGKDGRAPRVELKPIYPAQPRSARRARSVDSTPTLQPTAKPIGVHITVYYDNDNSLTYTTGDTLISEETIYNGVDGRDGIDGKSATIETKENQGGTYTITIINPDGTKREIIVKNGQDGKSPIIETKENADGSRAIVITNPDGTKQEFVVKNGKDGRDGKDGIDGKSATVEVKENSDGTHTLVITNPDGTKQGFVVKNGKDGRDGKDGKCDCSGKPETPREDKPQEPKGDKPETSREDKPQEPKGDKPETPREDKPEDPKGDKPETPRGDKPQEPKEDKPVPPREDKPEESKGDKPQVPSVTPQIPMKTPEQLLPTIDGIKVDGSKGMLAKTGEGETDTSVFIGSTVLLALYLVRRKEN